nr:type I-E CRISPR-associated protein Cas5/CasD [Candidatus Sigynarchaeota archaeon]
MAGVPLLLLRLEGPLQSWGTRARWGVRDTGREPSKSGVLGILGCALGYPRGDARLATELDASLHLGVREDRPGKPLQDFHTIKGYPLAANGANRESEGEQTEYHILSPKDYLQDASFLAVISGDDKLLVRCHAALMNPAWPYYLGRRCCVPSRPLLIDLNEKFASIRKALENIPWDPGRKYRKIPAELRCVEETERGEYRRQDRPPRDPARLFGFRQVTEYYVPNPAAKEA